MIRLRRWPMLLVAAAIACSDSSSSKSSGGTTPTGPTTPVTLGTTYRPSGHAAAGDVLVHLFEWRWADIARECETFLGPAGYAAVQISPPSEHAIIVQGVTFYPWWQRYQTVSYKLDQSRSGTQAELSDMVSRCKAVGVKIYADVVINHMTAGSGTGSAGSAYTKYSYPQVPYTVADFHGSCGISDYSLASQVQGCELVGLADLATESESVRDKIAGYLIALNTIGIAGFRVDAAKHMAAIDLDAIFSRVNAAAATAGREKPYYFLEISDNAGEGVRAASYYGVGYASGGTGDITDFRYADRFTDALTGRNGGTVNTLLSVPPTVLPDDKSVVFVDNHDTQRGGSMNYATPGYELAIVAMLALPHGYPSVMSSFGFDGTSQAGRDASPPTSGSGVTQSTFNPDGTTRCTTILGLPQPASWICEHRRPAIASMVAFRRVTQASPLSNCGRANATIDGATNRIAFCRDGTGFVVINATDIATAPTLPTRLPAGTYCDVGQYRFTPAAGGAAASCTGPGVVVSATGDATLSVAPQRALALHTGARLN